MKSVEEFIKEIKGSKKLQDAIQAIRSMGELEAFLNENSCAA